jgi:hypothetical protein
MSSKSCAASQLRSVGHKSSKWNIGDIQRSHCGSLLDLVKHKKEGADDGLPEQFEISSGWHSHSGEWKSPTKWKFPAINEIEPKNTYSVDGSE